MDPDPNKKFGVLIHMNIFGILLDPDQNPHENLCGAETLVYFVNFSYKNCPYKK